jgi:hypothetical protein
VSGVVTPDGQPLRRGDGLRLRRRRRAGRPAHGTTGKDGAFRLSTLGNEDGALRRHYKVVIAKYVPTLPNLKVPEFPDTLEGRNERSDFMYRTFEAKGIQPFKNALPARSGDSNTTPLECDVTGRTTVKFELTGN